MEFHKWWDSDPGEIYWLEVTNRKNLGVNLNAPQLREDKQEYYGYSLINAVRDGDVVFHYHKEHSAIVAWSRVSGEVWGDQVVWGAHGTSARDAGFRPYSRPGWRLGLSGTQPLSDPVTLDELRTSQDRIRRYVNNSNNGLEGRSTSHSSQPRDEISVPLRRILPSFQLNWLGCSLCSNRP